MFSPLRNRRISRWLVLVAVLSAVGISLQARAVAPPTREGTARSRDRTDQYGDPLPRGAIARIGTVRFRAGCSVTNVRFSPDGKTLVSMAHDEVVLWDPRTGKELRRLQPPPSSYRGNFSPDGRKLWLQTYDGTISAWDVSTPPDLEPAPVIKRFKGQHTWFVRPFPDGKLLATGNKNVVQICDITTGTVVQELFHESDIRDVALSADGKLLVSYSDTQQITLWNPQAGKRIRTFPPQVKKGRNGRASGEDAVIGWALSPDGKRIATSSIDPKPLIRLWDVPTGKEVGRLDTKSAGHLLQFSPNGKALAQVCPDGLHLWDVATRKESWHVSFLRDLPFDMTFSPDGKTLACGLCYIVRLWDTATGKEVVPVTEHRRDVGFAWLSPDGRTVLTESLSSDGRLPGRGRDEDAPGLRFWDARTGRQLAPPKRRFPAFAALSADGKVRAGWGDKKVVEVHRVATGEIISRIPYEGEAASCELSPDGTVLLLGTRKEDRRGVPITEVDVKMQLWDVKTGKTLHTLTGHKGLLWGGGAFSADGKRIATVGYGDKSVRVWDVATGREAHNFESKEWQAHHVMFSPDGRTLVATPFSSGPIRRWDTTTGKELPPITSNTMRERIPRGVYTLGLLQDGKTLITTDHSGKVYFWEIATGRLRLELDANRSGAWRVAVSSDGKTLLTVGPTDALVWDLESLLKGKP